MIGKELDGRYLLKEKLGHGNQGDVYLARDEKLERQVAIKLLNPNFAASAQDSEVSERLRREAKLTARFEHPHVVKLYDYHLSPDGRPYLVMEYLAGTTMEKLNPPLTAEELRLLVTQIGYALQNAHENGLVHRDMKPANIMFVDRGKPLKRFLLLDLGIAKLVDITADKTAAAGQNTWAGAGTLLYMSPEQAKGGSGDHRSDIYSLGCVLYEFLTGRAPFLERATSPVELWKAILDEPPPRLGTAAPAVTFDEKLEKLLQKCLQKMPGDRPQSVQDVVERFEEATRELQLHRTELSTSVPTATQCAETWVEEDMKEALEQPDQTQPDQTQPDQTQSDENRPFLQTITAGTAPESPTTPDNLTVTEHMSPLAEQESGYDPDDTVIVDGTESSPPFANDQTIHVDQDPDRTVEMPPELDLGSTVIDIPAVDPPPVDDPRSVEQTILDAPNLDLLEEDAPYDGPDQPHRARGQWIDTPAEPTSKRLPLIVGTGVVATLLVGLLVFLVVRQSRNDQSQPDDKIVRTDPEIPTPDEATPDKTFPDPTPKKEHQQEPEPDPKPEPKPEPKPDPVASIKFIPPESLQVDEGTPWEHEIKLEGMQPENFQPVFHLAPGAPDGMSLSGNQLSWTPTEAQGGAEPFRVTIQGSDKQTGWEQSLAFNLAVNEVNQPPKLVDIADQLKKSLQSPIFAEQTWRLQISARDDDLPQNRLQFKLDNHPPGMSLEQPDEQTARISWTPDLTHLGKSVDVTVTVDDGKESAEHTFQLRVFPAQVVTNSIGMQFALIPAGDFGMGSPDKDETIKAEFGTLASSAELQSEQPRRRVLMNRPFYLGLYEVTRDQFQEFVKETGYQTEAQSDERGGNGFSADGTEESGGKYSWKEVGWEQTGKHPVVNVTWNDAQAFANWLTETESKEAGRAVVYRLPTEAEWEYACRAGTETWFSIGNEKDKLTQVGNVPDRSYAKRGLRFSGYAVGSDDGYVFTAPVGRFQYNAFGLFDMHGNVGEWCSDVYDKDYYRKVIVPYNPKGPKAKPDSLRVVRGGSWRGLPFHVRSAARGRKNPDHRDCATGFRVVREYSFDESGEGN